jgi:hypothetical protein
MAGSGKGGEKGGLGPREAAEKVQPGAAPREASGDGASDPREDAGFDQPQSSAQRRPEPPERPGR